MLLHSVVALVTFHLPSSGLALKSEVVQSGLSLGVMTASENKLTSFLTSFIH